MRADRIAQLLPENYRASNQPESVLDGLLGAMEALHELDEQILADVDRYFDPARSPTKFLPMLAAWLDLGGYVEWSGGRPGAGAPRFAPGMERLRVLITRAPDHNARRGTRAALEDFLEAATGHAFSIEESPPDGRGRPRPFHIVVHAPREALRFAELVERIVEAERPAYATFEIIYSDTKATEGERHG